MSMSSDGLPPLPEHPGVYGSVLELIGDTPLVEIAKLERDPPRARVLAKMEHINPGGSVKDRICLAMIERAERDGRLGPGGTVVEPTSGNTGIGLALVARRRGYRCILTMPESMSLERRQLLSALGAEVQLTPEAEQMEGAIAKARELVATIPGAFLPQQFENDANPEAHYASTFREIVHALGEQAPHAFVAAVGTGGTITGCGGAIRERNPTAKIIAVEPAGSPVLSGGDPGPHKIQGIGAGFVPKVLDRTLLDRVVTVTDDEAYQTAKLLAKKEGLLVGISAGANVFAAQKIAEELGPGKNVVTILCDTGERYISIEKYFNI